MKISLVQRWTRTHRGPAQAGSSARGRRRRRHIALEALEERITLSLTLQMVLDINPNTLSSYPSEMVAIGSTTYFVADDGIHERELWKSDGTADGTVMLKDIYPGSAPYGRGSNPSSLTDVNGTLFFLASDGVHGTELWKSDGTAAGTVMVKDINPGIWGSNIAELTAVNATLFFRGWDGESASSTELWKSDGTEAGTIMVKNINRVSGTDWNGDSHPQWLTNVNGTLFFTTKDDNDAGDLWKSDGTAAGTVMVKDFGPISGAYIAELTAVNGTLFFRGPDDDSDGYLQGHELWKSDGTAAGTVIVKDIYPYYPGGSPLGLIDVNGTLFFTAWEATHGREVWRSDGTAAGTVLLTDINSGSITYPVTLTNVNGTLFFTVHDDTHGTELWRSDGTAAGTTLVKDIHPGSSWRYYGGYYSGYDYIPPWSRLVANSSYPGQLTSVNGTLFFTAQDGNGVELWRSDGTAAGTTLVEGINTGGAGSSPSNLRNVNGTLFLSADDGVHGVELWKLADDSPPPPPPPPAMSIRDVSVVEGHTGNRSATFTVTLSAPSTLPVTVSYSTANGTAAAPSDYTAASGTLVIPAGQTRGTIVVPIIGDRIGEADETFVVNLSGATNATIADGQAVGTIVDDEPRISISDVSKQESNSKKTTLFTFTVTLSAAYDQAVTMSFRTVNGTATTGDGDYAAGAGTLTFAPGETTRTVTIVVNGDRKRESNETFYLDLYGKSSNSLFFKYRGIGTILNDD